MKKNLIISALVLGMAFSLAGCELADIANGKNQTWDLKTEYSGTSLDEGYYLSSSFTLVAEVNGYYKTDIPFKVKEDAPEKCIYNLYLYEEDFFYAISSDYKNIYATLRNGDNEYFKTEVESGKDYQINVLKSGVYEIIFDKKEHLFDFTYVSEIETPVYYQITECRIGRLNDNSKMEYTNFEVNPENKDEMVIRNYPAKVERLHSFFNNVNTSKYKVTIAEDSTNYIQREPFLNGECEFLIEGNFDIYLNTKTYVVRVVLTNPDQAKYFMYTFENGDFVPLRADKDKSYIFYYTYTATSLDEYGVISDSLPKFYNASKDEMFLTTDSEYVIGDKYLYFKAPGTYDLTINYLERTVEIEKREQ